MPHTRTTGDSDNYFGTSVADPYRWLEDAGGADALAWMRVQNALARDYLDRLPGREPIEQAVASGIRLPAGGLPLHRGPNWFRFVNDGEQAHDVVVVSAEPFGDGRILIDPQDRTTDDTAAVAVISPSPDGKLLAYAYLEGGTDWRTWRIHDLDSGVDLPDVIRWTKFVAPQWLADGSGFVYGRFDAPDSEARVICGHRLMRHRLGSVQDDDQIVLELPDEPDVFSWPAITTDGRWLVVCSRHGTDPSARIRVRDLNDPAGELRPIGSQAVASWRLVDSVGDELVMITDLDAPLGRVVALHARHGSVRELVAETEDRLDAAVLGDGRLVISWAHLAASRLSVHDLEGAHLGDVELPALGRVTALLGRVDDPETFVTWTSPAQPDIPLVLHPAALELSPALSLDFTSDVITERVWVDTNDGASVPTFLVHRPEVTAANGPHPTWLFGYGGFDVLLGPVFETARHAFAQAGGVVALPCVRGGGEFGQAWHDAGRLAHKQASFDDAAAVADHLVESGWTEPGRLGLSGRSNGGLLAGALLTQRPELFAAIVPEAGVLDMLRYPLWTIGRAWISDYGDPLADVDQFTTLHGYSPLHNLRAGANYPPVLVTTAEHDDRVVPAHSLKFAAALQAVSPPGATALIRVEQSGGHLEGRSLGGLLVERTDVLAFLAFHTGLAFE